MKKAIELAEKGIGFTSPNPVVGAVVVKNRKIIGQGYHKKAGGRHAEVVAIENAEKKTSVKGAILYVTLEPCCHYGKTPPCTDLIISSGIKKLVIGMRDPFKKVNGRGIRLLSKKGVHIIETKKSSGLARSIRGLNQPFIKWVKTGMPYVVLKAGISLDGKIATRIDDSKWITGKKAREDARLERSACDAVLVGCGTVAADDPELSARGRYRNKKILRVIIDPMLESSLNKKVFRDDSVFVACSVKATRKNKEKFLKRGIDFRSFGGEKIAVKELLGFLGKRGIQKVFVEGGSGVLGAFYDAALKNKNLVDVILFYVAPMVIGGTGSLPVVGGKGIRRLSEGLRFKEFSFQKIGKDIKIIGRINQY